MTWTQVGTEQSAGWGNVRDYPVYIITESGFYLTTESGDKLICETEAPITPSWQTITNMQSPNWATINTI